MLGAFSTSATQHTPSGTFTTDRYNNKTPNYTDTRRRLLAQFPGNSMETDNAAQDEVIADMVILLAPSIPVSAQDEWTLSDSLRYRVAGQPRPYRSPFTGTAVTQVALRRIS